MTLMKPIRAALALSAALAAGPALAEELSFAHFVPPAHIITQTVVDPISKAVAENSGGDLSIRVYPGGELGPGPVEQYARVVQGVADMAWGLGRLQLRASSR
jgi:TRAP-type transport system periplasmic protein